MPVIYSIGGGKGGVGKSFMVASLGASLAMRGNRVVLVDLDRCGGRKKSPEWWIRGLRDGFSTFFFLFCTVLF